MTIHSGGGWLMPERKKAIVVSLYIWVPLALVSALVWEYYNGAPMSKFFMPPVFLGTLIILGTSLLLRQKGWIFSTAISFLWNFIFGWFILAFDLFYTLIAPVFILAVPPFICYVYYKKNVLEFGLDAYILSVIFPIFAFIVGLWAGYILAFIGIRGLVPY